MNVARAWDRHGAFMVGVVVLAGLFTWLSAAGRGEFRVDAPAYIVLLGAVYRFATTSSRVPEGRRDGLVFAVVVVGLVGLLAVISGFSMNFMTLRTINLLAFALFALGLNLQFGFTGIINFGHVAFMGIGAYTTVLLSRHWVPRADALSEPGGWGLVVFVGAALLVFLLVGVVLTVLVDAFLEGRVSWGPRRQHRVAVAVSGVAGLVAALGVVLGVGYPLSSEWAAVYVVAATVLVGMLGAALFGLLLGLPTLRLRADYLAIVTIGAAEILRRFWLNEQWLTEGPQGVGRYPIPFRGQVREWEWLGVLADALGIRDPHNLFLLLALVGVLALVYVLYEILVNAPYGRVLKAIREDEEVASALGKNVFSYKLQALALGSAIAALAGSFLAWHRSYISPNTFLPLFTFYAWIIVVIGGIGSNKGTILGAFLLWAFFDATRFLNLESALGLASGAQAEAFRVALIGLLLILFMMFKPEGVLGKREEMVLGD